MSEADKALLKLVLLALAAIAFWVGWSVGRYNYQDNARWCLDQNASYTYEPDYYYPNGHGFCHKTGDLLMMISNPNEQPKQILK